MDPIATHFCFLTEVEGQFQRRAQFITVRPDAAGDRWELATGQRSDALLPPALLGWNQLIRASARCLPLHGTNLRTYEVSLPVGETEDTVELEPSENTTCFLMGIRGAMQDSAHGAHLIDDDTNWVAHLLSGHTSEETRLSAEFDASTRDRLAMPRAVFPAPRTSPAARSMTVRSRSPLRTWPIAHYRA